jgi:hypothetical protein
MTSNENEYYPNLPSSFGSGSNSIKHDTKISNDGRLRFFTLKELTDKFFPEPDLQILTSLRHDDGKATSTDTFGLSNALFYVVVGSKSSYEASYKQNARKKTNVDLHLRGNPDYEELFTNFFVRNLLKITQMY